MNRRGEHYLTKDILNDIAKMYGIVPISWGPVEGGYRNASYSFVSDDGKKLNFILYKREPGSIELIERTNALGAYLSSHGLNVRTPVDDRILRVGGRYGSLYGYLDGQTIPWEAYTMKHIKLLGWVLADFHKYGRDFGGDLPNVEDVYLEINNRMKLYFSDEHVTVAMKNKLDIEMSLPNFETLLVGARQLSERQVLHMDLVRSNVLFRSKYENDNYYIAELALSGILDLEKAARGHVMFDIARTLAFLLVDCPKPAGKVQKYFLDSGYKKRGQASLQKMLVAGGDFLERLVTMFLTYDFYKFLRQNPYESLHKNHHYIRTVSMLRARKVIQ